MTIENVDGRALLSKLMVEGSGDFLLKLLVDALQHVMEAEVSAVCGAEYGERSAERLVSRNGYRPRTLETRMGTADLAVPKLRRGSYFPSFLEPRRRWEKAFVNVVSEAYILGVSTRRVEELVEAMGAKGVSRSEVSRMAASLDEQVAAFRTRPLSDMTWPYIWLDALYLKVREGGRVVSKAFLVAYGVNNIGERQVVGCSLAAGEMETAWRGFLEGLVPAASRESSSSSRTPTRAYGQESEASSTAPPGSGAPCTSCATCSAGCPATHRASRRRPCAPCSASPTGRWRRKPLARPSRCWSRSTLTPPRSSETPKMTSWPS